MYIIEIGLTRYQTDSPILEKLTRGDKWPMICDAKTGKTVALNAEQIVSITYTDGHDQPKSPVDDIVGMTIGSILNMGQEAPLTLKPGDLKGADE